MKARVSVLRSPKVAAEEFAAAEGVSLNQFGALALPEKMRRCKARRRGRNLKRLTLHL